MNEKINYINLIINKDKEKIGTPTDLYIHSILHTIKIKDLIEKYLTLPDTKIKKSIESNIEKRIEAETSDILYSSLYNLLPTSSYYKRQRIRKILLSMLSNLDKIYTEDFFNTFYNSTYRNDIAAALQISHIIWNTKINRKILDDYLTTEEKMYLETYLENGNLKYLLPYIEHIWNLEIGNRLKLKILNKLCPVYISKLEFLQSKEPDKYLYALSLSNIQIDNKILIDCLSQHNDELRPYGILNLGKLGKWNLIEKEIIKYINSNQ